MNGGLLKELSGGDTIYSRGLFKPGREFKPQAKFVLVSNALPEAQLLSGNQGWQDKAWAD